MRATGRARLILTAMATPRVVPALVQSGSAPFELEDETVDRRFECDLCGEEVEGEPAGRGLFIWTRGEELRYEEPPLCEKCGAAVYLTAMNGFLIADEEEEG